MTEQHIAQEPAQAGDSEQHGAQYTQGVCEDGAAILKDGQPMTIEEILAGLREREELRRQLEEADKIHTAYCCVLDHATGNRMSKAYFDWQMVCRVIDEHVTEQIDDAIKERDTARNEREALLAFVNEAIDAAFNGCGLDGAWIQERAVELDLLTAEAYDPNTHRTDCELFEPGDTIYVRQPWMVRGEVES